MLQERFPKLKVDRSQAVISQFDGKLYTSAGISAGIDMSFMIVLDIFGEQVARATAKEMEYSYPETFERRIQF